MMTALEHYTVVFDLLANSYRPPWFIIFCTTFALLASASVISRWRGKMLPTIAAIGFLLVGTSMISAHWRQDRELRAAVNEGRATVIEGPVLDFERDPWTANLPQRFRVGEHRFAVHASTVTPAFRQTVSRGGPDLTGKCVRIVFVRDTRFRPARKMIVWLGVREDPCEATESVNPDRR